MLTSTHALLDFGILIRLASRPRQAPEAAFGLGFNLGPISTKDVPLRSRTLLLTLALAVTCAIGLRPGIVIAQVPCDEEVVGACDAAGPQVLAMSLSPSTVDVANAAQTVNLTLRLTDDLAGVMQAEAYFQSPDQQQIFGSNATRVSGIATDGTWQAQITIPRYAITGTWTLRYIRVVDEAGNGTHFEGADADAAGFAHTFEVTIGPAGDQDADGVPDQSDNCVGDANPEQMDNDEDGTGDACDATPLATVESISGLIRSYLGSSGGQANALIKQLQHGQIRAFQNHVRALSGTSLDTSEADTLIRLSQRLGNGD